MTGPSTSPDRPSANPPDRFKVDLRGIIDLAANHLYTSPDVFVRELIQNAVDAITARRAIDPSYQGSIRLELTTGGPAPTICVSDDGIGLTTPEVHDFLSTVGGSSKREDAEAAAELAAESGGFLGRFGIGLLSCFMVTDEITVVTRSARSAANPSSPTDVASTARAPAPSAPPPAVEWRGRADGSYTVRELPDSTICPGTSVYIAAKKPEKETFFEAQEYFDKDKLVELARRYAEMLNTPIVVAHESDTIPINQARAPWDTPDSDDVALADYCQQALGFRPLDIFRIDAPAGGVAGFAFIRPDRANAWANTNRLYAHGMFVTERPHGLIPPWATFIGCVFNAKGLRLTASREGVHRDDKLDKAGDQIAAAIRGRLARLLRADPGRFAAVLATHDTDIRGLAVKDREFFDLIIDLLEFDTTLGRIRFGEFHREHERLLIARTAEQFRRLAPIAAAAGLRVFNGGYTYHEELLARAAERHPDIEFRTFDTSDLVDLLPEPHDQAHQVNQADQANPAAFDALIDSARFALAQRGCEPAVRAFEPAHMPGFFALGLDAEFHRQLDRTKSMASGVWKEVLDAMAPRPQQLNPTRFCLNALNPLVRRIAALHDDDLRRTAVEVLYVQALMSGQHALSGGELALLNSGMEKLLARVAEASS